MVSGLVCYFLRDVYLSESDVKVIEESLLTEKAFDEVEPALGLAMALNKEPRCLPLPKLEEEVFFYGSNDRPDCQSPSIHLGLKGSEEIYTAGLGEAVSLSCAQEGAHHSQYHFAEKSVETPLSIQGSFVGKELLVQVSVQGHGETTFLLKKKDYYRTHGKRWELDTHRVDSSLLSRMHVRWYGTDLFIKEHGGSDFATKVSKQRLDFGEHEARYSCFVEEGDVLIWKEGRWHELPQGEPSSLAVMLYVKSIQNRVIQCELWDKEGKSRVSASIVKNNGTSLSAFVMDRVRFLGAKTWKQSILELQNERVLVKPHDWLLHDADKGWVKLVSKEDIDSYVQRQCTGELFVIDGVSRKSGRQSLIGHIFNEARTEMQRVELALKSDKVNFLQEREEEEAGNNKGDQVMAKLNSRIFRRKQW